MDVRFAMYIAIRDFFVNLSSDLDWGMDKPFLKVQKWAIAFIYATPFVLGFMLALNVFGAGWFNLLIATALSPIILTISLRWKRLAIVMGIGTFVALLADSDAKTFDKSRGALTALEVMARIQFAILITLWIAAVVLGFVPWAAMPSAFWAIAVPGMVLVAYLEYRGYRTPWVRDLIIILGCSSIIVYFAYQFAVASAPQTVGGKYFDEQSGLPLVMMEDDGSHVFTDKLASACAKESCFSPFTGKKLVPISPEVAAKQGLIKFIPAAGAKANDVTKAPSKGATKAAASNDEVVREYDLFVPASGCSEVIPNTDPKLWVNPAPKNPEVGWPKYTFMTAPGYVGWVEYVSGASYSALMYCDNGFDMWMHVEYRRGRLKS